MKILIAEDERIAARQLEAVLTTWGYQVVVATNGIAAWEALQDDDAPRLAILDWMMPGKDGVELCREIRALRQEPYTYIVLLTEKSSRQDIIEGLNAGADDYLAKPFDAKELEARLRAGRRVLGLMEEVISSRDKLQYQATHDVLTGLFNRLAIREMLTRELARASREATSVGIILIDVDKFKDVNDEYGHFAGDALLCEIARSISSQIRVYDSASRYGGEEFLVVLPGCDLVATYDKAEALRKHIANLKVAMDGDQISATASMGVAAISGASAFEIDDLIRAADTALYQAKDKGRNRVESTIMVPNAPISCQAVLA
jgi:two-component system, cell cycle response regulator